MILRTFCLLLLLVCLLLGESKKSVFDIEYGFLKELGSAEASLKNDGKNYSITILANTKGFARFLSRNRQEIYTSSGTVENEIFLPSKFIQQKSYADKLEWTIFSFDHKAKKVTKTKEKFEDGKRISSSEETLGYYADNDILTLYFNIAENLKNIRAGEHKIYHAVGANPKDGKVDVIAPEGEKLSAVKQTCVASANDQALVVIINQKIFQSENGELFILFDEKSETKRAVLKNVILFGDIRGVAR